MQIIAYTPHGVFKSQEEDYSENKYEEIQGFLEKIGHLKYITFKLSENEKVYLSEKMIGNSLFVLKK